MSETSILLAVIGSVGLLSTLAVVSRGFRANEKYERKLKTLNTNRTSEQYPEVYLK